ncbi:MAG: S8 family serine peptidase [Caldilineaceae bacterium]
MAKKRLSAAIVLMLLFNLLLSPAALAVEEAPTDGPVDAPAASHRLIVQLRSPSLAEAYGELVRAANVDGKLDVNAASAQAYVAQLQAEQAAFMTNLQTTLPSATLSRYINEAGAAKEATYQVVFNGMSIDPGATDRTAAMRTLLNMPNVKAVYADRAYSTQLYTSTQLINAPLVWNSPGIGGIENAGAGVKVASMDGGVHHMAPMMDGAGYEYPAGYGPNGLGLASNNNGKIIASRVYFRNWDPPAPGDENPWPGQNGTSHGMHTSSTAAGDVVTATYNGFDVGQISGVAPKAYVMSYRVFYASVNGNESFYTTEGIAALEDIVKDGADVLNNSWGEGPTAIGGEFDPLDQALINAVHAGIFVSMSNGNAGPALGSSDHPSSDYINVAASTTSGTLAAGRVGVKDDATLQDLAFSGASFGAPLPIGQVDEYAFLPAAAVDAANVEGCNAWPANTFTGKAALISRGSCEFGLKVLNAEQGGAEFVVVYNHAAGGDGLINMGPGAVGDQVTISSIFIGQTNGLALVDFYNTNGADASILVLNTIAFQAGNTPDQIISFSSRGPAVGNVLKPDIAAPGVNILAQGYTEGVTGEARHLGYGQVSGTSMAAPHVAGAAALLQQLHGNWSTAAIKSAMMSTSKYIDIYNADGAPAQPLDMGAGRLDVAAAMDPGVILSPPSLSYGIVPTGTQMTIAVNVTGVATATETYTMSTLYTGDSFTATTALPGFNVSPASVSVAPGETKTISVTFDSAAGAGLGENQGYILLSGDGGHNVHMPAWARVTPAVKAADVLLLDNDLSALAPLAGSLGIPVLPDYQGYYTETLTALGYTYAVWDVDEHALDAFTVPEAAQLFAYDAVIYFTGDNYIPVLSDADRYRLTEFVNNGGILIAMGQDLAGALQSNAMDDGEFLYNVMLGANYLQDSVTGEELPVLPVVPSEEAPPAFRNMVLDLTGVDLFVGRFGLDGLQESPPVTTTTVATASVALDAAAGILDYEVEVKVSTPMTLTASHIHSGTVGVSGPVIYPLFTTPVFVTDTYTYKGSLFINNDDIDRILNGQTYINVHSNQNLPGEVRGQVLLSGVGDGASNQYYVDEIMAQPPLVDVGDPNMPEELEQYVALFRYPGLANVADGIIATSNRAQPSLEADGLSWIGRTAYTAFGLEGINNSTGVTSREQLLGTLLDWGFDEPTVYISNTTVVTEANKVVILEASVSSNITGTTGVSYRWDFGDGSPITHVFNTPQASHTYFCTDADSYTVRVEATDSLGNVAIGSLEITPGASCTSPSELLNPLYLPLIMK